MPQIRVKEFNNEEIGMGFNSQTGELIGTALEVAEISENKVAPGQQVFSEITIINTHEELMEKLGMSFEAQGRYGFFQASAKADFSSSSSFNSQSTFLVARCLVTNSFIRGRNFRVKPEAEALLKTNRFEEFKTAYGDSFVRGLQVGGELYIVIRITSVSITKQKELAAECHAEFGGIAGASFTAKYSEANKSASTKSEYSAVMFQRAGKGQQSTSIVTISEALQRFKTFPIIALENPVGYVTEIANYNTLPLPVPPIEEQESFLIALRDAREKKLYYLQKKNDFEFAFQHPEFFESPPAPEILLDAAGVYRKLADAAMSHAIMLSRGKIETPTLFTPSINEPSIKLKRVTPPAEMVKVPGILNLPVNSAVTVLESLGLNPKLRRIVVHADSPVRRMHVERQSPPPGTEVQKGSEVNIYYFCSIKVLGTPKCRSSSFRLPYFYSNIIPTQHYGYPYSTTRQYYPFFYSRLMPVCYYPYLIPRENYPCPFRRFPSYLESTDRMGILYQMPWSVL